MLETMSATTIPHHTQPSEYDNDSGYDNNVVKMKGPITKCQAPREREGFWYCIEVLVLIDITAVVANLIAIMV